ncbi:hypothetical protein ABT354_36105 [Streptomyces sp. NPDC000594]
MRPPCRTTTEHHRGHVLATAARIRRALDEPTTPYGTASADTTT